jgi:histidinol-phosphate/aromatic aminotransferase/cobyric acid decarboxylase-like protein
MIDLSASLNPVPPPLDEILGRHQWLVGHYPDDAAATTALADAIGTSAERLVVTNGGSSAIALVADVVRLGSVIEPEFSLYRRHLVDADDPGAGRWRSNPANPLGTLAAEDESAAVWDEAYWPMVMGTWTRGDDAAWRLGSLTKLWACPGLRLGYLVAPDVESAATIRARQPRWSVSSVALATLVDLLDAWDLAAGAERIARRRADFAAELIDLGYRPRTGVAPWLLLDASAGLRELLAPRGIAVRDCTSYGMPGVHRVALPVDAHLDRVLSALADVRAGCGPVPGPEP